MRSRENFDNLTRVQRLRIKRKRRRLLAIIIGAILITITTFIIRSIYLDKKCQDLYYSANYNLTSRFNNEKLLRVDNMTLVFSDVDTAMVEAHGFSTESPHKTIGIKGRFLKNNSGSWILESTYSIDE
jgi:hypothetical protein